LVNTTLRYADGRRHATASAPEHAAASPHRRERIVAGDVERQLASDDAAALSLFRRARDARDQARETRRRHLQLDVLACASRRSA